MLKSISFKVTDFKTTALLSRTPSTYVFMGFFRNFKDSYNSGHLLMVTTISYRKHFIQVNTSLLDGITREMNFQNNVAVIY